jgi:hypothetical protein
MMNLELLKKQEQTEPKTICWRVNNNDHGWDQWNWHTHTHTKKKTYIKNQWNTKLVLWKD